MLFDRLFLQSSSTQRANLFGIYCPGTANQQDRIGILLYMKTSFQLSALVPFFLGTALVCAPASGFSQPSNPSQDNGAKQDMKDAGHETKDAAKDTGRAVDRGTEKAYHSTKQHTKKTYHSTKRGTEKAWDKTENTTKGAVNGGKEGARQPQ